MEAFHYLLGPNEQTREEKRWYQVEVHASCLLKNNMILAIEIDQQRLRDR